jgi:hypothetical protein
VLECDGHRVRFAAPLYLSNSPPGWAEYADRMMVRWRLVPSSKISSRLPSAPGTTSAENAGLDIYVVVFSSVRQACCLTRIGFPVSLPPVRGRKSSNCAPAFSRGVCRPTVESVLFLDVVDFNWIHVDPVSGHCVLHFLTGPNCLSDELKVSAVIT